MKCIRCHTWKECPVYPADGLEVTDTDLGRPGEVGSFELDLGSVEFPGEVTGDVRLFGMLPSRG